MNYICNKWYAIWQIYTWARRGSQPTFWKVKEKSIIRHQLTFLDKKKESQNYLMKIICVKCYFWMKCRWAVWLCHGAKAHVCILIQFSCPLCASYRMTCDRILQNQYQTKIINTNRKRKKHFCWIECGSSFALVKITDHEKLLPKWMHWFAPFDVHSTQSRFALYSYHQDYVCNFEMFAVDDIGLL